MARSTPLVRKRPCFYSRRARDANLSAKNTGQVRLAKRSDFLQTAPGFRCKDRRSKPIDACSTSLIRMTLVSTARRFRSWECSSSEQSRPSTRTRFSLAKDRVLEFIGRPRTEAAERYSATVAGMAGQFDSSAASVCPVEQSRTVCGGLFRLEGEFAHPPGGPAFACRRAAGVSVAHRLPQPPLVMYTNCACPS